MESTFTGGGICQSGEQSSGAKISLNALWPVRGTMSKTGGARKESIKSL